MLNRRKITVIALLLLIIGVIGALMTYPSFADIEPVMEEKVFNEAFTDIVVEADNSKIEIIPSADTTAKVEFNFDTSNKSRYIFEADVKNDELKVKVKEKVLQFFNFDFHMKSFVTKIYLPEQTYNSIMAETENGAVAIDNITAISITGESTNGSVHLKRLAAEEITAETENGKINFEAVAGELRGKTTNGRIEFETERINQPIDFETVNGKIIIRTDEKPKNAEVHAEVVNGSISIFGEKNRHTVFGNGENKIELTTVNGGITVE